MQMFIRLLSILSFLTTLNSFTLWSVPSLNFLKLQCYYKIFCYICKTAKPRLTNGLFLVLLATIGASNDRYYAILSTHFSLATSTKRTFQHEQSELSVSVNMSFSDTFVCHRTPHLQGVLEKNGTKFATPPFCNHMSQSRAVSMKCPSINCLHDTPTSERRAKYSLFCSWHVNYSKT